MDGVREACHRPRRRRRRGEQPEPSSFCRVCDLGSDKDLGDVVVTYVTRIQRPPQRCRPKGRNPKESITFAWLAASWLERHDSVEKIVLILSKKMFIVLALRNIRLTRLKVGSPRATSASVRAPSHAGS